MIDAQAYLPALHAPGDIIEFRAIWPERAAGHEPRSVWRTADEWQADGAMEWTLDLNRQGWNIYAGVLPRTRMGARGNAETCPAAHVWADIDHVAPSEAGNRLRSSGLPHPSVLVNTGHGVQCYWLLTERQAPAVLRALVRDIAARLGSDSSVQNEERVLRVPGFVNHKPPVANAELLECHPDLRYDIAAIRAIVPEQPTQQKHVASAFPPATGDHGMERCRRYLAMIAGSGPGGRTNTAFRAACVMVNDIGIAEGDAVALLSAWDMTSNSPSIASDYGGKEIGRIVRNAKRHAKKPKGCLNAPTVPAEPGEDVDLSGILSQQSGKEYELFPRRFLAVPGFVGRIMAFNLTTAPKPQPVLALAGALALLAVLCSRKLTDSRGTRPNIYLCGVAQAGAGKDHARQVNKRILTQTPMAECQAEAIKSGTALINSLVINNAMLFQIDEFGRFIKVASNQNSSPHIYEIVTRTLELYSSSGDVYAIPRLAENARKKDEVRDIVKPHLVLYGTTVPRSLYEGLTEESVTDGFLARVLVFDVDGNNPRRRITSAADLPEDIIEEARWWADLKPPGSGDMHPSPMVAPITKEAMEIAEAFIDLEYEEQQALKDSPLANLWARTAQNADKLALLYAASRDRHNPVIDHDAAHWGYGLAEWLTRRMVTLIGDNVADNPFHAGCLKVKRIIKNAGGKLNRNDLSRKMKIKSRELDEIVDLMQDDGTIQAISIDTPGRRKTEYRLVD